MGCCEAFEEPSKGLKLTRWKVGLKDLLWFVAQGTLGRRFNWAQGLAGGSRRCTKILSSLAGPQSFKRSKGQLIPSGTHGNEAKTLNLP